MDRVFDAVGTQLDDLTKAMSTAGAEFEAALKK